MQLNQPSIQPVPARQTNLSWTDRSGACARIQAPVKKGPFCQRFSITNGVRAIPKTPTPFEIQAPASLCPVPMSLVRTGLKKQSA